MAYNIENLICGVYSITNPIGEVYIGCSKNIELRKIQYKTLKCKSQQLLYQSLLNYGYDNHTFKIIKILPENSSSFMKRFWETWVYLKHKSEGYLMMNIIRPNASAALGKVRTPEHSEKIAQQNRGKKYKRTQEQIMARCGAGNSMYGKSGILCPSSKRVIDKLTGQVYDSVMLAARTIGVKPNTLAMKLTGYRNNNTQFKYL